MFRKALQPRQYASGPRWLWLREAPLEAVEERTRSMIRLAASTVPAAASPRFKSFSRLSSLLLVVRSLFQGFEQRECQLSKADRLSSLLLVPYAADQG